MLPKVAAIVVSHNSESTLERCVRDLESQEYPFTQIILVDSGSSDTTYLNDLKDRYSFQLICTENIGFSKANNLGYDALASDIDYVVFVNPDLFLTPDFLSKALEICAADTGIAMLSGKLLGYDLAHDKPSGRIDSTGIQRLFYGRWVDRGQGEVDNGQYDTAEEMEALCGALLFCRATALKGMPGPLFDPDFFLYKEDIELSIRLRKQGHKVLYHPLLEAYHCRGWQGERKKMSSELRVIASKSELLLYKKHPSPYILFALFKYVLVKAFRL